MKRISIVLLVLMMWGIGMHAQHSNIISVENAWNIVKNEILKEKGDSICVYVSNVTKPPQAEIKTIKGSVATPSFESWFFFVDDMPYANWEHSCRYIYVNAKTGSYEVQYMNRPPKDNMDVLVQYKPANKSNVKKIQYP
ncbi:MAG: hypothetical protein IJ604_03095 [Prevotella sp.]|nr:hypothetical protein [Prevotella sp.]